MYWYSLGLYSLLSLNGKSYSLTKDPLSLGIIGLMEIIPALSMALFAGHIVDQREKRNLFLWCIGLFSLISFGLFFLSDDSVSTTWSHQSVLYCIYAFVFFGGLLRAFFWANYFFTNCTYSSKKAYPNAATWSSSTWQMASLLGPAVAGFTINWIGVHWSLCIVFVLVIIAFLLGVLISKKPVLNPKIGEPVSKRFKRVGRFVFKTKAILGALSLDMIAVLLQGVLCCTTSDFFTQDILKVGSEGFGILRAAPAVGAFLTMLTTAYIPISKKAGLKLLGAVFGFGVSIIVFGLSSVFWISVVALFFSGVTDGVSMVIRQTILQLKTPDHMRGRVSSEFYVCWVFQ